MNRNNFWGFAAYSVINVVIFCFPANWVWGPKGWLKHLGVVDLAGAGPVYLFGGVSGIMSGFLLEHFKKLRPKKRLLFLKAPPFCPKNSQKLLKCTGTVYLFNERLKKQSFSRKTRNYSHKLKKPDPHRSSKIAK